jgi:hypothetical protein
MAANGSELDLFESTYYASKSKIKFHSWYDSWAKRQGRYIMFNSNGVDFYDNNFHKFTFFWTPNSYYYFIDNTLRINATFGNGDNTIPQIGICQVAENLKMDARIKCNQGNWGDGPSTYWDIQNHNNKCAYSIKSFKVYQNTNFIPYILNYWLA